MNFSHLMFKNLFYKFSVKLGLTVVFTVFMTVFCTSAFSKNGLEYALEKKISPKLTLKQEQWLLALSGLIMEVNNDRHITLEVEERTEAASARHRKSLQRSWGIYNREDLIERLKSVETKGHNVFYQELRRYILDNPHSTIEVANKLSARDLRTIEYYNVMRDNYSLTKSIETILAWDLGRATSLIRWGYQIGYLTETESWNLLYYFGKRIQKYYSNWDEYAYAYAYARIIWSAGIGKTEEYRQTTLKALYTLQEPDGLWDVVPWEASF